MSSCSPQEWECRFTGTGYALTKKIEMMVTSVAEFFIDNSGEGWVFVQARLT